jgi:hypothetical protein
LNSTSIAPAILSARKIAARLGIDDKAVRRRHDKAIVKLRRVLGVTGAA